MNQLNFLLPLVVFAPFAGSLICYLLGAKSNKAGNWFANIMCMGVCAVCAGLLAMAFGGKSLAFSIPNFCGLGLNLTLDGFRALYITIACVMWVCSAVFSLEHLAKIKNLNRYHFFVLLTLGATLGVFLSADLFTAFVFFEIMSFTSYMMVVQDEKPTTMAAGQTYIAVAILGGLVMLMGLFLLYFYTGTLQIDKLYSAAAAVKDKSVIYLSGALILFGFGAKAGIFMLHVWMPKAYAAAPAPASALLSSVLSKVGVYGILVISCTIFQGDPVWSVAILLIGMGTMLLGALLAVFCVDLKRTLAFSSMSQIGFILTGTAMIGFLAEESGIAAYGTLLHMVNHSVIKLVLFLCAGVVYQNLHCCGLNDIRGFGKDKPLLKACFALGGLSLMGVPLFSGYISKTLIHESIVEKIHSFQAAGTLSNFISFSEVAFLFTGGLTAAYVIKIFVAIFVNSPSDYVQSHKKAQYISKSSALVIGVPAGCLLLFGVLPHLFMDSMAAVSAPFFGSAPMEHQVAYFGFANLKGAAISLFIGAVVYLLFIRVFLMKNEEGKGAVYLDVWPKWLDLERLIYRPILEYALPFVGALLSRVLSVLTDKIVWLLERTVLKPKAIVPVNPDQLLPGSIRPHPAVHQLREEIENSLSFSFLLMGAGLSIALIYMLSVLLT